MKKKTVVLLSSTLLLGLGMVITDTGYTQTVDADSSSLVQPAKLIPSKNKPSKKTSNKKGKKHTKHSKKKLNKKTKKQTKKQKKQQVPNAQTSSDQMYNVNDSLDHSMFNNSNLSMNGQINDSTFNPNPYIDNYKVGQYVAYHKSNTGAVLSSFPTSETDISSNISVSSSDLGGNHKIIDERIASWGIKYYLIQFNNNVQGWVTGSDISPNIQQMQSNNKVLQEMSSSYNDLDKVNQFAFHYVNYIRIQHGLAPLQWNDTLSNIAQKRTVELQSGISHFNSQGETASEKANELGYSYTHFAENAGGGYNFKNIYATAIDTINAYVYQDGLSENWGHRDNILYPDAKYVGISILPTTNGFPNKFTQAMLFSN